MSCYKPPPPSHLWAGPSPRLLHASSKFPFSKGECARSVHSEERGANPAQRGGCGDGRVPCEVLSLQTAAAVSDKTNSLFPSGNLPGLPSNRCLTATEPGK